MSGYALTKPEPSHGSATTVEPAGAASGPAASARVSFADVFQAHAAYVLGLLRRLGVAEADVEDVAQEVFVAVHRKLPGFEGRSSLKTWLCGICLRTASDYRRAARRRREHAQPSAEHAGRAAPDTPDDHLLRQERVALLQRALQSLPEAQLQVFVLYELEELPMTEVARAAGCPRFTAYTRLRAARRALRAFYEAHRAPRRSSP